MLTIQTIHTAQLQTNQLINRGQMYHQVASLLDEVFITCAVMVKICDFEGSQYICLLGSREREIQKFQALWSSHLIIHNSNSMVFTWLGQSDYRSKPSRVKINCSKHFFSAQIPYNCPYQLWVWRAFLEPAHSWTQLIGKRKAGLQKLDQRWKGNVWRQVHCNIVKDLSVRSSERAFVLQI